MRGRPLLAFYNQKQRGTQVMSRMILLLSAPSLDAVHATPQSLDLHIPPKISPLNHRQLLIGDALNQIKPLRAECQALLSEFAAYFTQVRFAAGHIICLFVNNLEECFVSGGWETQVCWRTWGSSGPLHL
ncbi:hypothetical protein BJY01DRAFT_137370 [Aspergillus pseudoustus]|uniref:Uncharacterized protein n=1 Tax=Aspergillus pseudoustus TaxID=1810923 RepID=A0ABR4KYC2_9EURO